MLKGIMKYAGKYKKYTIFATLLIVLAVSANIAAYFFAYKIIKPLIMAQNITVSDAIYNVIAVLICLLANAILYIGGLTLSHISAFNTLCNLRTTLQSKCEKLPLGIIKEKGTGSLKKLLVNEIESLEVLLAHAVPEGIGNTLIPLGVLITLFIVDWKLALLTFASLPLAIFGLMMMTNQAKKRMGDYYHSGQVMNNTIIEYINGMEVVKIFNKEGKSYQRYKNDVCSFRDKTLDWFKACWPWMSVYSAFFGCCTLFTLPLGALFAVNGIVTLPKLILALYLSFSIGGPLLKTISFIPSLAIISKKVKTLESTLDASPLKVSKKEFEGTNLDIELNNVTFAYKDVNALKDVSINIKNGCKTAFVGESGSGKSTIAKLLVHYYDVNKGNIKIGGQDITDMSLESLNNHISYVSQEQFLFNTSIFDNIKVGNLNATNEEVIKAAEKAQCNEFLKRLDNGIYTMAGDCGNQLSGGEKQRVSLARAILKDAPIVVLDEATAFADAENEEKMEAAISEIVKDKTLIVIAHRLETIRNADCIYVMDKGEVICNGKHEDLLNNSELYNRLWHASEDTSSWKVTNAMEENSNV